MLGGAGVRYRSLTRMLVVRTPGAPGGETYVKGVGRVLPRNADPSHIDEMLALGVIEKVEA